MPAPYDTKCYNYDKYKCIYDCSQKLLNWSNCSQACAMPGCRATHLVTLSHTATSGSNLSKFVIQQSNIATSTVFTVKTTLEYIVLNVLGLLGVFFGLSVLRVAKAAGRCCAVKRKNVKTTLLLICFTGATAQCLFVIGNHMEYLVLTETLQGLGHVSVPKSLFSVCFDMSIPNKPWSQTVKPQLADQLSAMAMAKTNLPEFWLLTDETVREYERSMSTYSVGGRFCYLLDSPKNVASVQSLGKRQLNINVALSLMLRGHISSCEVMAHFDAHSIQQSDLRIKTNFITTLQNTYVQAVTLPYPYTTACQEYGHGHLKDFKSRADCINACALRYFEAHHQGQHPVNIPIFNGSDPSYVTGDAQEYIHSCETTVCRWTSCEEKRFKLYTLRQLLLAYEGSNQAWVVSPGYQVYQLQDVPLTLISDTLLVLISTIGLWTGVSMLAFLYRAEKSVKIVKRKPLRRKVFKKIRLVIPAIGLLWHLYSASIKYSRYETLSQTSSQQARTVPKFSLLLIHKAGREHCPNNGRCTSTEVADLAIQYFKQSQDFFETFWSRDVKTASWFQQTINASRMIKTYIYGSRNIVSEASLNFSAPTAEILAASGSLLILKVDILSLKPILFTLVESIDEIEEDFIVSKCKSTLPGFGVIYEYESFSTTSLSAPYVFDCINYLEFGFRTQKSCYYSCLETRFFDIHHMTSSAFRPLPIAELSQPIDDRDQLRFLYEEKSAASYCQQLCKKSDCFSREMIGRQTSISSADNGTTIAVSAPTYETSIKQVPKMTVGEFVMYLGNTFGIWYGLCALDLVRPFTYLFGLLSDARS
ncbi:hypothetical protein HDE_03693 [Halotydeus destructor]|nr:hypothetical protein HDE_03693 [Halotydeus destructor]